LLLLQQQATTEACPGLLQLQPCLVLTAHQAMAMHQLLLLLLLRMLPLLLLLPVCQTADC
jgi:hypothetical protein